MIRAIRRNLQYAHRLRQLRRLIAEAPTASVRWDLLTIAARSLDPPAGTGCRLEQSPLPSAQPPRGPAEQTVPTGRTQHA